MTSDAGPRPPIDREHLLALLDGTVFDVDVLEESPSTNREVADRARAGAPHGTTVVAEHQTAGRGRLDRTWETPARAALTLSVLLRPDVPPVRWPWLPLLTGLAVHGALADAGVVAGLKWPNDVLLGEQKVAGILVERVETDHGPAAVVGVGLNVSTTAEELPVATATSLGLGAGVSPDRTELLAGLLRALAAELAGWRDDAADVLRSAYTAVCVTIGQEVRVDLPVGTPLTGRAVGIDEGGRLLVEHGDQRTAVGAGDVIHVRPGPGVT
ncbi:biotin--[acetyl-CoA-carboxylase] ligase [Nocardioides sp.]|uniref:biotin--[acetyl-CoA-carboxylase] ligase n=1 Tax=Nocardioides sp. TaxID=35761 RepID=UPI002735D3D2|nr:biotin--[acetyl-CoA-carboxylase] ligase [Nocardioides sp.]MDP3889953.1 biotin--[acetyl-CoA-carboxylase] ligase [Nocardioides sp.]